MPWVHSTSITAQSSGPEAEWLSTDAIPGVAPNTNAFFCPSLYLADYADPGIGTEPDAYTVGDTRFMIDCTYVVDVRG